MPYLLNPPKERHRPAWLVASPVKLVQHPPEVDGDRAVVLYDFTADGDDELTVGEGDTLLVLERDGDEWWKCKNQHGIEGVVPASYVEVRFS